MVTIQTGIGFGDSGKGALAHFLTEFLNIHTIIKTGGGHGGHTVTAPNGRVVRHSHFGGGTLAGAKTFLSREFVVIPSRLAHEIVELDDIGADAWGMIALDEYAPLSTLWHIEANCLKELARGASRQSTSGMGVGEAIRDAQSGHGLFVKDLREPKIEQKLAEIRERKQAEVAEITKELDAVDPTLRDAPWRTRDDSLELSVMLYKELGRRLKIVEGREYLAKVVSETGNVLFQSSQGAGISPLCGFPPYATSARVTPDAPLELLREVGYDGDIVKVGAIRTYMIRHGNGPFPTESRELTDNLPDPNNGTNEWQGTFRIGQLDAVLLRYTTRACGGFNGLAVSCLDQLAQMPKWQICNSYKAPTDIDRSELEKFFELDSGVITNIRVHRGVGVDHHNYQQRLGELLRPCAPQFDQITGTPDDYLRAMEELIEVPVAITASGPRAADRKVIKNIWAKP